MAGHDQPKDTSGPKLAGFYNTPQAAVRFSGSDLATLLRASHAHYDAACRSLARRGGVLHRLAYRLLDYNEPPAVTEPHDPVDGKEAEDAAFTQACRNLGEAEVEEMLDSTAINFLMKITEFGTPFREGNRLFIPLRRIFVALEEEYKRINTPKSEEGR